MGTIFNIIGIIAGGLVGLIAGKLMTERFQKIIGAANGLAVISLSLSGIVAGMLVADGDGYTTQGTYVIIFSLVLGSLFGEMLDIDSKMERFGEWLKQKTGNAKDASFVDGFVTASLTVCIGAMAVLGAIMDGLNGDHTILITKAILDFTIIMVMTSSMGKGCIFSAIPVGLWQGCITLLASALAPVINDVALDNISLVGSILILAVGLNILLEGKFRIKVANMMPAIIFAVVAAYIPFLS